MISFHGVHTPLLQNARRSQFAWEQELQEPQVAHPYGATAHKQSNKLYMQQLNSSLYQTCPVYPVSGV
jgi:hypothetical protein